MMYDAFLNRKNVPGLIEQKSVITQVPGRSKGFHTRPVSFSMLSYPHYYVARLSKTATLPFNLEGSQ